METNEYLKRAVLNGWEWELCTEHWWRGTEDMQRSKDINYRFSLEGADGKIKEIGIFTIVKSPMPDLTNEEYGNMKLQAIRSVIEGYIIKVRLDKIDSIIDTTI